MSAPVTPRMHDCLQAIRDLTVDGVPPTYDEISDHLSLNSRGRVHALLSHLKRRGLVEFSSSPRSIRLVEEDLSPARIERLDYDAMLRGIALMAGLAAHRRSGAAVAQAIHRIADALEHKPREALP